MFSDVSFTKSISRSLLIESRAIICRKIRNLNLSAYHIITRAAPVKSRGVHRRGGTRICPPPHFFLAPTISHSILTISHSILSISHSILTISHCILTILHKILTISHSILTISHSILTISHYKLTYPTAN